MFQACQMKKALTNYFYKQIVCWYYRTLQQHKKAATLRLKQHVPTSIWKKSSTVREQPHRMCKNITSKVDCESAIAQHLITNPECAKTYTDDNLRTIGQARSSFHLGVLGSVYIKTQNPVLCRQKEIVFSLKPFN